MKIFSLILLICLLSTGAFATYYWEQTDQTTPVYSTTDNWTEPNQWSTASGTPSGTFSGMPPVPSPASEVKFTTNTWMSGTAHCTINSNIGSYTGQNISVNGNMYINGSANIGFNRTGGGNGLRVGSNTAGGSGPFTGTVYESAGTVTATNIYLGYGGSNSYQGAYVGTGNYVISGGSLSCSSSMDVGGGRNTSGSQQTVGKFTINGDASTISVTALSVGGADVTTTTNSGTLEFLLTSSGTISAIGCTSVSLDAGGANSTTALLVTPSGTPLSATILLVKNTGSSAVVGSFDSLNGGSAAEGASVVLGGNTYTLTYMYDFVSHTVGTSRSGVYNDIALVPEPATIALLALGLFAVRSKK